MHLINILQQCTTESFDTCMFFIKHGFKPSFHICIFLFNDTIKAVTTLAFKVACLQLSMNIWIRNHLSCIWKPAEKALFRQSVKFLPKCTCTPVASKHFETAFLCREVPTSVWTNETMKVSSYKPTPVMQSYHPAQTTITCV